MTTTQQESFGQRLRRERESQHWTQEQAALATLLDLPEQAEADQKRITAAVRRWLHTQQERP